MVLLGDLLPLVEEMVDAVLDSLTEAVGFVLREQGVFRGPLGNPLGDERQAAALAQNLRRGAAASTAHSETGQSHHRAREAAIQRPRRERRHTGRLHAPVERLMVGVKPFVFSYGRQGAACAPKNVFTAKAYEARDGEL